jgi:serine/threonine-protein phosphatase 6 regulatory ankyrin repeat subunit B
MKPLVAVVLAIGMGGSFVHAQMDELMRASARGDLAAVNALVNAGADVNKGALFSAASNGHLDVVKALLAAKADVNGGALEAASANGHLDVVETLLAAGADINAKSGDGFTALMVAARNDHPEIVRALLAVKADVDATRDFRHRTALMEAMQYPGHDLEMVKMLVAAGADLNVIDATGSTALMEAASKGRLAIVQVLLAANANVNIAPAAWHTKKNAGAIVPVLQYSSGPTALTAAVISGRADVVQALLAAHADPNPRSSEEYAPLTIAASKGRADLVRMLLHAKADVNAMEPDGSTALSAALKNGHEQVAGILRAAGS